MGPFYREMRRWQSKDHVPQIITGEGRFTGIGTRELDCYSAAIVKDIIHFTKGHTMRKFLISAGFTLLPLAAAAQSTVDASDANVLAALLKNEGYFIDITTDKVGDPLLKGKLDGTNYDIFFYDCTNNANCRTIQFQVGYDMTNGMSLQRANQWNSDMRYATVHLDDEMDPFLQMDLNIDYGVSSENFVDNFKMWANVLGQFEDFIDWN
ncbi:hypothetical protein TRP8649_01025 [Pelagimonas phthalicica]|uniref:Sensory transduction regulator n=2 Tax=Rhodobacterales TaxID=204455 RepID=A0A238J9R5_9RHOB|nr:putative sensory transduction regulator [Pelagimonas phthalicica]SMX26927.1 hypothetical protein TRP8649_01025 [Pelagimonas phthalicica]